MKHMPNALLVAAIGLLCVSCSSFRQARRAETIRSRLGEVNLTGVDFRMAGLADIVDFINDQLAKHDDCPRVVLILADNAEALPVTLNMGSGSALTVIEMVAKLTDSQLYARENHLFIEPRSPRVLPYIPEEERIFEDKRPSNQEIHGTQSGARTRLTGPVISTVGC